LCVIAEHFLACAVRASDSYGFLEDELIEPDQAVTNPDRGIRPIGFNRYDIKVVLGDQHSVMRAPAT
jgi:hypothetical protein